MTTKEKLRREYWRIKRLLDAPADTLIHRGGPRVVAQLKSRLRVIDRKLGKLTKNEENEL